MSLLWTPERQRQANKRRNRYGIRLEKRGNIMLPVRYAPDPVEPRAATREGRESEERDAWHWVESKLIESGCPPEEAEKKIRKVRELAAARDREKGIDRTAPPAR